MSSKKIAKLSTPFIDAVRTELGRPRRDTVAIMSLNLGCPKQLFSRTHAHLLRETIALLPQSSPTFKALDIRGDQIFCLARGTVPELVELVEDTHQSLIVLEVQHPQMYKFCMSFTIATPKEDVATLIDRANHDLEASIAEFSATASETSGHAGLQKSI